jgi:hypothetical protein
MSMKPRELFGSMRYAQQGDNDLSVGLLVQAVSESPYASDTLIIITEDDCQDGPDHVDSHRATTYFVGPYVKEHALVSTHYSQVNALRTIEDIVGTQHISLNTAFQRPMADVFDVRSSGRWSFSASASTVLETTELAQLPPGPGRQVREGSSCAPEARRPILGRTHGALRFFGGGPRASG